jgi:hypothetical protein
MAKKKIKIVKNKMDKEKYPIFCGTVVSVSAIIEQNGDYVTVIHYLTEKDHPTEEEIKEITPLGPLSFFLEKSREKINQRLQDKVKGAVVPMRVDPSVILGAEIRTRFGQLNLEELGEGAAVKTYELEVIKGKSHHTGDIFSGLAEHFEGPPHSGMRYIKILDENS